MHAVILELYLQDKRTTWLSRQSNDASLFLEPESSASLSLIFFHSIHRWPLALCFFWSSLEKKCPERRRRRRRAEEKHFHSVIQRHLVNASILSLTTGVNCRSYSPTHSTFLLEGEAETLRLKWDEECGKKMLQLPAPHTVATSYFFPFPAANSGGRGRRPSLARGVRGRKHRTERG